MSGQLQGAIVAQCAGPMSTGVHTTQRGKTQRGGARRGGRSQGASSGRTRCRQVCTQHRQARGSRAAHGGAAAVRGHVRAGPDVAAARAGAAHDAAVGVRDAVEAAHLAAAGAAAGGARLELLVNGLLEVVWHCRGHGRRQACICCTAAQVQYASRRQCTLPVGEHWRKAGAPPVPVELQVMTD